MLEREKDKTKDEIRQEIIEVVESAKTEIITPIKSNFTPNGQYEISDSDYDVYQESEITEELLAELKLTENNIRFVERYLMVGNATKSYQEVYNCNYTTAKSNAPRLMKKDNIKRYMDLRLKHKLTNYDLSEKTIYRYIQEKLHNPRVSEGNKTKYLELYMKSKGMLIDKQEIKHEFRGYNLVEDDDY